MPDLLLELRSEEIPARMQRKAAGDLKKMVADGLVEAGLTYEAAREYWTPRRLTLDLRGVTARSRDVHEEIKGPSTKAPPQAIEGFLRKAGLSDVSQAHVHSDPKKGDFYVAHISRPGRAAEEIIAGLMPGVIRAFPWPKSMRWGPASGPKGARYGETEGRGGEALRWVRPLQSIVCTFGPETEEPVVVDFEIDGIRSGNVTWGHRFHAPGAITVKRFDDYAAKLEAAKVIVDAERRKEIILADAKNLAFANGLDLVEDDGLLEEVSGLVEWPVVLLGAFEEDFLSIPAEVIRLTIRANQKCFVTRPHGAADALSNRFVVTANIEAKDHGKEIAHGNGKVVRARLSDALYFWKTDQADLPDLDTLKPSAEKFGLDLKKPLDQRMARLDRLDVTFHAKLGTQGERVTRIARLAEELAATLSTSPLRGGRAEGAGGGTDEALDATSSPSLTLPHKGERDLAGLARRAAVLAKADLQTEVVGEFPELQGAMGRKYALLQGEDASVAAALEEHYKPQGPSDRVPTDPVSVAVALADKLDTLVGFWAIDEKPTGSKDPYALRRAALGVIRIVIENGVRLRLQDAFEAAALAYLLFSAFRPQRDHFHGGYHDIVGSRLTDSGVLMGGPWHEPPYRYYLNYDGFLDRLGGAAGAAEIDVPEALDDFDEKTAYDALNELKARAADLESMVGVLAFVEDAFEREGFRRFYLDRNYRNELWLGASRTIGDDLLSFFRDRLKVYLRDQGARHDLIDAVITPASDDLLTIVRRVEALGSFLDSEDGKNLLAGAKRAANILAAEEKKGTAVAPAVDPALFRTDEEKNLAAAVNRAEKEAGQAIRNEDFSAAMLALSALREPVDSFFERVLVNDEDQAVRANRLALLARIRAATGQVADFSKIAG